MHNCQHMAFQILRGGLNLKQVQSLLTEKERSNNRLIKVVSHKDPQPEKEPGKKKQIKCLYTAWDTIRGKKKKGGGMWRGKKCLANARIREENVRKAQDEQRKSEKKKKKKKRGVRE